MCSGSKVGHSSVAGHEVTEDRQLTSSMLPIDGVPGYGLKYRSQRLEILDMNDCMYEYGVVNGDHQNDPSYLMSVLVYRPEHSCRDYLHRPDCAAAEPDFALGHCKGRGTSDRA